MPNWKTDSGIALFVACVLLLLARGASDVCLALDPHKAITQYSHDVWQTAQGLPQNSVYSLCQTRDGYLWIGTWEGLARFDGVRFVVFDRANTPAIKSNWVSLLFEDRAGNLWFSTHDGGVVRYGAGVFTNFSVRDGLPNNAVTAMDEDQQGALWIGTANGLTQLKDGKFVVQAGAVAAGITKQPRGPLRYNNEVALDFNAGLTCNLARLAQEFGGQPLADFPPVETATEDEFFVEARINASGNNFSELRTRINNRSGWPPRNKDKLSFRYLFTLDGATKPEQITVTTVAAQAGVVSGPHQLFDNIYYVTVDFTGVNIFPGGLIYPDNTRAKGWWFRDVTFRITSAGAWAASNDPSSWNLPGANADLRKTPAIPVYDDGVRIFGYEPRTIGPRREPIRRSVDERRIASP